MSKCPGEDCQIYVLLQVIGGEKRFFEFDTENCLTPLTHERVRRISTATNSRSVGDNWEFDTNAGTGVTVDIQTQQTDSLATRRTKRSNTEASVSHSPSVRLLWM